MAGKPINPMVKTALELGPIVLFFIGYLRLRDQSFDIGGTSYDGFILVTAAFIPLIALSTFVLWRLTGHISRMQIATLVLVTLFGGLSVWFNDDRFFKMKPTMIYLLFGGALGLGLLRGQSYLKYVMEEMLPLKDEGWMLLTKRLTAFFLGLAVLNEIIWRTQTTDTWVYFKTFGLSAAVFVFFMTQAGVFSRYALDSDSSDS
ncbi:septation protein IspZ [Cognatishimia sp. SS12]|uniref:inner membrane-spanning protein YciB n=1 Tax=Cognatishimia sp. SS12 TaxID=2979465 RepID=UPI0023311408|nr:inner membrane-spanning protein YciB [Cognatishimia sp. SS12]MDC0738195.1 septation protein IspZ [Cognatishimia sp. SS12]